MSCTVKGMAAIAAAVFLLPANSILVRFSKRHPASDKEYLSFTVNCCNELLKMLLSFLLYFVFRDAPDMTNEQTPEQKANERAAENESSGAWRVIRDSLPYAVPACLYMVDNNVFYVVMLYINPATFQLMNNVKIIFVALLFRYVLQRSINRIQWIALCLLVVGLVVSELDALHPPVTCPSTVNTTLNYVSTLPQPLNSTSGLHLPFQLSAGAGGVVSSSKVPAADIWLAFALVCVMCFCSAVGNIMIEHLYKTHSHHLLLQNVQLYGWGALLNLLCLVVRDRATVFGADGPFVGFTPIVWLIILFASLSGLSIAFILKYSDNIGNVWAHAASLVLTALVSAVLFNFDITLAFVCGCVIVKLCGYLYHASSDPVGPASEYQPVDTADSMPRHHAQHAADVDLVQLEDDFDPRMQSISLHSVPQSTKGAKSVSA